MTWPESSSESRDLRTSTTASSTRSTSDFAKWPRSTPTRASSSPPSTRARRRCYDYLGATGRLWHRPHRRAGRHGGHPRDPEVRHRLQLEVPDRQHLRLLPRRAHLSAFASGVVPGRRSRDPNAADRPEEGHRRRRRGQGRRHRARARQRARLGSTPSRSSASTATPSEARRVEARCDRGPAYEMAQAARGQGSARSDRAAQSAASPASSPTSGATTASSACECRVRRTRPSCGSSASSTRTPRPKSARRSIHRSNHVFGPAGLLEQEDGENWSQSTRQTNGYMSKKIPQLLKMNLGTGQDHQGARLGAYRERDLRAPPAVDLRRLVAVHDRDGLGLDQGAHHAGRVPQARGPNKTSPATLGAWQTLPQEAGPVREQGSWAETMRESEIFHPLGRLCPR